MPAKPNVFADLIRERIATQCLCCGGDNLKGSPAVLMPFVAHRTFGWEPVLIDESWGLRTIKQGHAYSVCRSLYCEDCGFLFLDFRFSETEVSNLYRDYRGEEYTALREKYEPGYIDRNRKLVDGFTYIDKIEGFLEPHLKFPVSILDWGGDTGKNSPFKERNKVFDIYDISDKDVVAGAAKIKKQELQLKKYDLIVCSNVLEHVTYPSDLLLDIARTMDEKSVLYIEVPVENVTLDYATDLHLHKKHWHEHVNFFSEKSLRALTRNVGLEVLDLRVLPAKGGGEQMFLFQVACKLMCN